MAELPPHLNMTEVHVLIVDDDSIMRWVLRTLLAGEGANVEEAENGEAGLTKVLQSISTTNPFALILMDMQMPVMDGFTATAALRAKGISTPIIAVTSLGSPEDRMQCQSAGCNAHVHKPVDHRELIKVICDLTQQFPQMRGLPRKKLPSAMAENSPFVSLLPTYLERLKLVINEVEAGIAAKDAESVRVAVHRVRGTAANFGFSQITEAAAQCEALLKSSPTSHEASQSVITFVVLLKAATA